MSYEYTCPKKQFNAREIKKAQIFFRNGDYFELSCREIIDIDIQFYDTLIAGERGFCPVGKSGFIKCKINDKKPKYDSSLVYDRKEYYKSRKNYLEQRCVNEGGVYYVRLFDENSWHYGVYGDIVVYKEDDYLILKFQANKIYGLSDQNFHVVRALNVTKQVVEKIDLDFENCDGIEIFKEEIQDIQINFERNLEWNSSCFGREVKNGFIRLKFDDKITWRKADVYCGSKRPTIKNFQRRLCGKGEDIIDICHLYVTYTYAGYCMPYEECIGLKDIRPIEEQERAEEDYTIPCFISGYAKRENDGSILIVFGKGKEYCVIGSK